jgi:phosphoribosylformimino-5-aminoimidazole carboxamide ribotide isomerase
VQIGGGLREIGHVRSAIDAGAQRVILGTAAIENPELIQQSIREFGPDRVVLGIDARDGYVAVRGWEKTSAVTAVEIIERASRDGVRRVVYTDIARDGTLTEPNYAETERVAAIGPAIIASGGVSTRETLERLATIGNVEAAIVGRALYDGTIVIRSPEEWRIQLDSTRSGGADERAQ